MDAHEFDPLHPRHRPDPHPLYHRMRATAPVYCGREPETGRRSWFLTRYPDVQQALRDPRLARDLDRLPEELAAPHRQSRNDALAALGLDRHVLNLDPPDHTRLRRLIAPALGAGAIAALAPRIRQVTAELLDDLAAQGGKVDLIDALALPLPVVIVAELLGIPIDDRVQFRTWVEEMTNESGRPSRQAAIEFVGYLDEWIARRRATPDDDLISHLIQANEQADRLTHKELLSTAFLLLAAGHETSVKLIGNGALALLRHPAELARLRARPDLIHSAVDEILRFDGPVESPMLRFTLTDVEFGGVEVPRGEAVAPIVMAANRDPEVFPQPDVFDIARDPNRHLTFGHGVHFCLGAPLARLEGRIALDALVRRFPDLALAVPPTELEWTRGFSVHGVRRLPVTTTR
jgi:cytochrome P450